MGQSRNRRRGGHGVDIPSRHHAADVVGNRNHRRVDRVGQSPNHRRVGDVAHNWNRRRGGHVGQSLNHHRDENGAGSLHHPSPSVPLTGVNRRNAALYRTDHRQRRGKNQNLSRVDRHQQMQTSGRAHVGSIYSSPHLYLLPNVAAPCACSLSSSCGQGRHLTIDRLPYAYAARCPTVHDHP